MGPEEVEAEDTGGLQTPGNPFESFGELLEEEDLGGELNRTVYEALEEDLGYDGEASSRILAGEFGAGTPVEAFDAYLGLQIWGRMTGFYEEADDFLMGGGLQIKNPNRWGKRQEAYLREFRQDPESDEIPEPERLENVAKAAGIDSLEEIENYEDELRGLLTSSGAHREYVRDRMDEMLSGFRGRIEYAMGEEERDFNRKEEQARWINKLAKEIEDYREEKEGELEEAKESREELLERIDQIQDAYDIVSTLHEKIEGFYHNKKNDLGEEELLEELESKKQELWSQFEPEIDELDDNYQGKIEELFQFDQGWDKYREDYDKIDNDWGEIGEQLESLDTKVSDLKDDIAEVEWEEDHYVFSNLSNRKHIKAADAKVLNYLAMRSIQEDVMETFPREVRDQVDIHDRKQAEIDGEQEMPEELVEHREKINRIEKLAAETDYDRESLEDSSLEELERLTQEHGLEHEEEMTEADLGAEEDSLFGDSFLMHNTKWTNTPSEMSMMEALYEAQRKYRHSDRIKGDEEWGPDSIYVPHNAAGFEYTRRNLDQQLRDKWNDFEENPHEVSVMTMPPLVNMENLEEQWAAGTQNVHTKKIYKGDLNRSIPTGIVIQTRLEDDSEIPFFVPEDLLTDIGKLGRRALEIDTDSEEYDEILEEIEQLSEMRLGSVLANADWHEGKVNSDIGLSHREKIWRTLNYQADRYGDSDMPQSVLYSELIDGDQSWYGEENHSNGETTSWMRDELHDQLIDEEILEAAEELNEYYESDIGEEDIPRIVELQGELLDGVLDMSSETLSEFTENTESLPVPGASKQSKGTEPYLRFLDENLDPASYLLLTGNHPNSDIGHDEAHEIERALYKTVTGDLEAETFLFDGQGTKHGGFGAKKDKGEIFGSVETGRKFYLQHVTSGAKHYMRKIGKDLVDGGKDAADQVILNHIHKFGHKVLSDGTHVTVTPSVWNTDQVGEVSGYGHSSWGVASQLVNAAPDDHPLSDYDIGGVHYIGPETLHRDEFSGDLLENEFSELEDNVEAVNHDEIADTAEEFMNQTQPRKEEPRPAGEAERPDEEHSGRIDQLLEIGELDAEELLKMRFVEGEISQEEYQERMAVI